MHWPRRSCLTYDNYFYFGRSYCLAGECYQRTPLFSALITPLSLAAVVAGRLWKTRSVFQEVPNRLQQRLARLGAYLPLALWPP